LNKILHIEDDPGIREISLIVLETIGGFSVEQCASGKEGVEKASEFLPDLVLLDVMMPEMNGPETLEKLRAIPEIADIPAIFMTAKVQPEEVGKYLSQGVVAVITDLRPNFPPACAESLGLNL